MIRRLRLARLNAQDLNRKIVFRGIDWMKAADLAILQVLRPPKRLELRSGDIAWNADVSAEYASRRLSVLVEHDLVEKIKQQGAHPRYRISQTGIRFMNGELDVAELRDDSDE